MLKEGDVIELKKGMEIYANIPEHFVYNNRRGSYKMTHHSVVLGGQFDYLCGKYVVHKTEMNGGGCGHGPHDKYPDGHHVYCTKLDDRKVKVDFYQSGCFTATIRDIEPIGQAKMEWTFPHN